MSLAQNLYLHLDLFWIPVALLTVEKGKRILTSCFILSCALLMRLQIELMEKAGFGRGILGLLKSGLYPRLLVTYGLFIMGFLLIAHFSPGSDKNIHIAASITILIAAFCVSSLVMSL